MAVNLRFMAAPIESPWSIRYSRAGSGGPLISELVGTPDFQQLSDMTMALMDEFAKLDVIMEIKVDRRNDCAAWAAARRQQLQE